jgi:hypothetical protein
MSQTSSIRPPDPHGAAGPNGVLQTVNLRLTYWTKAGAVIWGPTNLSSFWAGVGNTGSGLSDPRVVFDRGSGRFYVIMQENLASQSFLNFAVSKTANPATATTADWYFYRLDITEPGGTAGYGGDYPGLGVDGQAVYVTYNMYPLPLSGSSTNCQIIVLNKAAVNSGTGTYYRVYTPAGSANGFTLQPCTVVANNPGNVAYFGETLLSGSTGVRVWALIDPLGTRTLTNFTVTVPNNGGFISPGAPQLGTATTVPTLSPRTQGNAFWNNGSIWFCHTAGGSSSKAIVYYYRVSLNGWPSGTPTLGESGGIDGGPGVWTYQPSIGVNARGDVALVYTISSTNLYPTMVYTSRKATDVAFEPPTSLKASPAYSNSDRWGDYASVTADPADETFWLTSEWSRSTAAHDWGTWWANVQVSVPSPYVYVRSTIGQPWGSSDNEGAMNVVFSNSWQDLRYETLDPNALFAPSNRFIYLEGSDNNVNAFATFVTNNLTTMQSWVAGGGSLLLNAAPNGGAPTVNMGFGVTLTNQDFTPSATAVNPAHQIFNGPFTPAATTSTGNNFGHATVSGGGVTGLLTNGPGRFVLAELNYGGGHVMFGGMTQPHFHSPQPDSTNMFWNILAYAGSRFPIAYVRSSVGRPWGDSDNEGAMNVVFANRWQDLRYETLDPGTLFSATNKFIFLEGSDSSVGAFSTFLTNNQALIQNWVAAGGSLLLNAAPNGGASLINLGFGVTLANSDFTPSGTAVNAAHPIFNGPYTPAATTSTGSYFGHATVSGGSITGLMTNGPGRFVLAERNYGLGHVMFGGMTVPEFHFPQPDSTNLFYNILAYAGSQAPRYPMAYVRSTAGQPWGSSDNEGAMNVVFTNRWQDLRFETLDPGALFAATNAFVFLEGSDAGTAAFATFITNNLTLIQNYVAGGGRMLINAGPNGGASLISLGFGVTLTNQDFTPSATAVNAGHRIFTGPYTPAATTSTGSWFAHATVFGGGISGLMTNGPGRMALAELNYGAGHVIFGGMTLPHFHSPQPASSNLFWNILAYGGGHPPVIVTPPADQVVAVDAYATLTVVAVGSDPLSYQWRKNGVNIPGANYSSYSIYSASKTDSGDYSCYVANSWGAALSASGHLTVSTNLTVRYAIYGAPSTDAWNTDVLAKIRNALPNCQVDAYLISGANPIPTLAQLQQYKAVLIYTDYPGPSNPVGLGNVLADYLDWGGGVVLNTFALTAGAGYSIQGRIVTGNYLPVVLGSETSGTLRTLVADEPLHPILSGVASFNGGTQSYHELVSLATGAEQVAHWSDNSLLITTKKATAGTVVALNFYPPSSDARGDFWSSATDGGRIMGNALLYQGQAPFSASCAYVRSTNGAPWAATDNEAALTRVFFTNWQDLRFETVNVPGLLSPSTRFIWLEGGDTSGPPLATFVTNNLIALQNWVAAGGSLFINMAPNGASPLTYLGFSITSTNTDFSPTNGAANLAHPIFNGPFLPVGGLWSGGSFSHGATLSPGLNILVTNTATGHPSLAERTYGRGHVIFGGFTEPHFQAPQPQATNLLCNILAYGATLWSSSTPASVGTVAIGWYDNTGFHDPANRNYFTGHLGASAYRSFFVFGIPAFNGTIASAQLQINTYDISIVSPFETVALQDVTTPIPTLIAGGSGLTGIYGDLADGVNYGYQDFFPTNSFGSLSIPLNAAFISAATAARGGQIALGGNLTSADNPSLSEYVFGSSGASSYDAQLVLTFGATNAPTITTPPASQSVPVGSTADFSVLAAGAPTLGYQWRKGGVDIPGATTTSYLIANAQLTDAANYDVRVTNVFGSILSAAATLTVTPTNNNTVISNGNLVITLRDKGARIYSVLYRGNEADRIGVFVSDWGLQTGTNAPTFVINNNNVDTTGQEMATLGTNILTAAYAGVYTAGGGNVAFGRKYQMLPGLDTVRITQSFTNWGGSGVVLRCFDTYDPDYQLGVNIFYYSFMDRYLFPAYGVSIQMGQAVMSNAPMAVIMGTADASAVVGAATATYFGIASSANLNSFFAAGGWDGGGALMDQTVDMGRELYLPPGGSASFMFVEAFGTNAAQAQVGAAIGATGRPYFVPGTLVRSAGVFQAQLAGPDPAYEIQASTDFVHWTVLGNVTMVGGVATVSDASGLGYRFYRARELP